MSVKLEQILEVIRRSEHNRKAIQHVYLASDGKPYAFDDYGNFIGEYTGGIPCPYPMPPELEEVMRRATAPA